MLCKLAWGNVRRASKDYLVYLLTLTLAVTVFYAFNTISIQIDFVTMQPGLSELLGNIMSGLTAFLAIVMGFLMVYANNFIMKRRKKEFGLYQVLGMSRGQVSRVMALETAIVSGAALVLGAVLGVGLSQLMTFFTASLFKTQISNFHFFFSFKALAYTAICLLSIFVVTLLFNLLVVRRSKVVELMSANRRSESIKVRNPWISAVLFIIGTALIGLAYYRLLRDGLPIDAMPDEMAQKNAQFGLTTGMVTLGTVLFFFGLSGFLLKVLQGVHSVYWRGMNMFTLRQLSAKVNTVSLSMAVIAMILFLAITSVTGGMSIASAINDSLVRTTPADYSRSFAYCQPSIMDPSVYDGTMPAIDAKNHQIALNEPVDLLELSENDSFVAANTEGYKKNGLNDKASLLEPGEETFELSNILKSHIQLNAYSSVPLGSLQPLDAHDFVISLGELCSSVNMDVPLGSNADANTMGMQIMKEGDYNAYLRYRGMDEVHLGKDGYLITCDMGETIVDVYDKVMDQGVTLNLRGIKLVPKADRVNTGASALMNSGLGSNSGTIIVPDYVVDELNLELSSSYLLGTYRDDLSYEETEGYARRERFWDQPTTDDGLQYGYWTQEVTAIQNYESANTMNGLISYLAIYIGFVLVVACAAILTIQQLSGVSDSGKSYRILSELGTSRAEIMRSVMAQQAVFFGFPLLVGVAHSLVALQEVIKLTKIFGGLSIGGTVGTTCAIFLLCYGGYFLATYQLSRSMVSDAIRTRHAE